MRRSPQIKWIILGFWLISWIYATRYSMLDDALIHLRYASFLRQLHFITYDGVHFSYGTSSLLYVSLLALLRNFTASALLPKVVSVVCYLLLIAVLLRLGRRFSAGGVPRLLWLGLVLTTLSPMAVRWLTDGMETGLVVLTVTLLAWKVHAEKRGRSTGWLSYAAFAVWGALLVLLRIELASLAALAVCVVIAEGLQRAVPAQRMSVILHGTGLGVGAVLAMTGIRLVFGHLLPDTALAKTGHPSILPALMVGHVILSSFILGIGTTLLGVLSGILLLRELIRIRATRLQFAAWACANASFPLLLFLASARGQQIQGVRYVLWPLFFATVWNALEWEDLARQHARATREMRLVRPAAWAGAVLLLCLLPFDWYLAMRAMAGRAVTFVRMRDGGLGQFRDARLVAGDVGFIGYFTRARVCDLDGLVNGRAAAALPYEERIARCVADHPQAMFLTDSQAFLVNRKMSLRDWTVCGQFDFTNVESEDRHYLMVPGASGANSCPRGSSPTPVSRIFPNLTD